MSLPRSMSPDVPKKSFDIEMGKRQAVAVEDFEDIQNQLDSVGRLERCETEPRHESWNHKAEWDNPPEISVLAAEFGMEHGLPDRQKFQRKH